MQNIRKVYARFRLTPIRFAFEYPPIEERGWWDELHELCAVFAAYSIDEHEWSYCDAHGKYHRGVTFIMPDYFTLEEVWDCERLDQYLPWGGMAEYIDPEKVWKRAVKLNIAKD